MFPSKALLNLSLLIVVSSIVEATPLERRDGKATLSFTTSINTHGPLTLPQRDRARIQAMRQSDSRCTMCYPVNVVNGGVAYLAQVGVGEPATNYTLLIDIGSSNTFVGTGKPYVKTTSSHDTGNGAGVSYGSGGWFGKEYFDTVTLSPKLVIKNQSIGVANESIGFDGLDGLLGLGPVDLTVGAVQNTATVPTVMDSLYSQGTISKEVLGIYFVPFSEPDNHGELTFGGYDDDVITGPVHYVPVTQTQPSSAFWGVDGWITYGDTRILSPTAGVVDTGTTYVRMASEAFQKYQSLTGSTMDNSTGSLMITEEQYAKLEPLKFTIGQREYELTPNAQIWPRSFNTQIGGDPNAIYLVVGEMDVSEGFGLDFILGYSFLERYYSILDTTNHRVGLARTRYTRSNAN